MAVPSDVGEVCRDVDLGREKRLVDDCVGDIMLLKDLVRFVSHPGSVPELDCPLVVLREGLQVALEVLDVVAIVEGGPELDEDGSQLLRQRLDELEEPVCVVLHPLLEAQPFVVSDDLREL